MRLQLKNCAQGFLAVVEGVVGLCLELAVFGVFVGLFGVLWAVVYRLLSPWFSLFISAFCIHLCDCFPELLLFVPL